VADRSRLWRNTSLERMELLVEQMKAGAGITEELKARDQ